MHSSSPWGARNTHVTLHCPTEPVFPVTTKAPNGSALIVDGWSPWLVLLPISPMDGHGLPGLLSLALDPIVSLTPPLISRSLWESWQWHLWMARMSAVYPSHPSQSEADSYPESQDHSEGKGRGRQGGQQHTTVCWSPTLGTNKKARASFRESQCQHTPYSFCFSAVWPPPSLHPGFLCLSTWGRCCPSQL